VVQAESRAWEQWQEKEQSQTHKFLKSEENDWWDFRRHNGHMCWLTGHLLQGGFGTWLFYRMEKTHNMDALFGT
jgi:hypothetical protein